MPVLIGCDGCMVMIVVCVCQRETALRLAAFKGHTEVVGILVEGGANINLKNKHVSSADWV